MYQSESSYQYYHQRHFQVQYLSDSAEFAYKCTDFYHPNDEGGLKWDDPEIGVEWPMPEGMTREDLTISDKDHKWNGIKDYTENRK